MSLIDDIKTIFLGGPETWQTRVKSGFKIKSPNGQEFTAKYIRESQSVEKNVVTYYKPFVNGPIAKDMGSKGFAYTFPFFFDGPNCDLTMRAVLNALNSEFGSWEIDHPVFGFFKLQPTSMTSDYSPIEAGGIATIESSWIEPLDETSLLTARQLAGIIDSLSKDLNDSMLDNILDNMKYGVEQYRATSKRIIDGIQRVVEFILDPMAQTLDTVYSSFLITIDSLNDLDLATTYQVEQMVGQLQQLVQLPLFAKRDAQSRIEDYKNLAENLSALLPGKENSVLLSNDVSAAANNHALITEVVLLSSVVALAQIAITTPIKEIDPETGNLIGYATREQVLSFATTISDTFDSITDNLDDTQKKFEDSIYREQYFSQSNSYAIAYKLVAATIRYLLTITYDLSIEKRFKLERPMTPFEVAVTQYKGFGEQDYNIDLFIDSNGLETDELLLLPAGREVLIYV